MFADRVENSGGGVFSCLSGKFLPKCLLETGKAIKGRSILVWCLLSPVFFGGSLLAWLAPTGDVSLSAAVLHLPNAKD